MNLSTAATLKRFHMELWISEQFSLLVSNRAMLAKQKLTNKKPVGQTNTIFYKKMKPTASEKLGVNTR